MVMNGTLAKILAGALVALLVGFTAGRFSGPAAANQAQLELYKIRLDTFDLRLRRVETDLSSIKVHTEWIRDALREQGFNP
jgi:hypothetical protein